MFTKDAILRFVKETFVHYDRFKDILLPLITALLLLIPQEQKKINVLLAKCVKPSM